MFFGNKTIKTTHQTKNHRMFGGFFVTSIFTPFPLNFYGILRPLLTLHATLRLVLKLLHGFRTCTHPTPFLWNLHGILQRLHRLRICRFVRTYVFTLVAKWLWDASALRITPFTILAARHTFLFLKSPLPFFSFLEKRTNFLFTT